MEFSELSHYSNYTILITFLMIIFLLLLQRKLRNQIRSSNPTNKKIIASPPVPGGSWPLIGHLFLLRKPSQPLHVTLGRIADEVGSIFEIKLGAQRVVVVSRWDMAKECFTTNDKVLANRPKSSLAMEILGFDYAMMGFSFYGPYWHCVRKIAINKLLSGPCLEKLKHIRESVVRSAVKEVHNLWKSNKKNRVLVDMKRWFGDINMKVILRMVLGKAAAAAESDRQCQEAVREFFILAGDFPVAEVFPFLRWLDLDGKVKAMKRLARVLDDFAQVWLEEHKTKKRSSSGDIDDQVDQRQYLMGKMLSVLGDYEEIRSTYGLDKTTKATCLNLILGATDTSTTALSWALSLLLNNREALKKAQTELDLNVGRERQVNESDIENLPYVQSIIKETLRLYPPGPLLVPHESTHDCTVGGFRVAAGTRVLINASKIQRDPRVWPEADEFRPERFLVSTGNDAKKCFDVRGQNFELIPFGSGRRMCPGVSLALQVMSLALASLIHGFQIETTSDEPLDMSESCGLTNLKASLLEVLLTPRLSDQLYE